jgi:hypothetical protein
MVTNNRIIQGSALLPLPQGALPLALSTWPFALGTRRDTTRASGDDSRSESRERGISPTIREGVIVKSAIRNSRF